MCQEDTATKTKKVIKLCTEFMAQLASLCLCANCPVVNLYMMIASFVFVTRSTTPLLLHNLPLCHSFLQRWGEAGQVEMRWDWIKETGTLTPCKTPRFAITAERRASSRPFGLFEGSESHFTGCETSFVKHAKESRCVALSFRWRKPPKSPSDKIPRCIIRGNHFKPARVWTSIDPIDKR